MTDRIFETFLARQQDEGLALAAESDLVSLLPLGAPADRYVAEFRCRGLVERAPGEIAEADRFHVGIRFPADYLRTANPFQVLTLLGPRNVWHPNTAARASAICIGRLAPGTGLVDILYQLFEILTWRKVTMREDDALNSAACQWARGHRDRFPVDRRPLKRRPLTARIAETFDRSAADGPRA
jgi:hypothetical protein